MTKRIEKIQNYLLKNEWKRTLGKRHDNTLYSVDNGVVYVCIAGTRLHIIPKDFFLLDLEKTGANESLPGLFNKTLECANSNAYATGKAQRIDDGRTLLEFKDDAGNNRYFDEKIIKEFGDARTITLLVNPDAAFSTAVVTIDGMYLGLVCPVRP